jgi:Ion channel
VGLEPFWFALGLLLLALVYWDAFETIVVPRPTPGWFRLARYIVRGSWRIARGRPDADMSPTRDRLLGLFAPAACVLLLVSWLTGLILGFGLVLFALRDELLPVPQDLGSAAYFAASSVLTLGFGDFVAVGAPARVVVLAAAASGLGMVALVITFLFSLFGSYQRRELSVVLLQAKAGVPPSAVVLLETIARMDLVPRLPDLFGDWERWAAEVLDSHVAYPLLGFFRSSHDNLSWISALGTVLDAASLVLTTILDVPRGQAELVKSVGSHLVEDLTNLGFRSGGSGGIDRPAFDGVCERLAGAGYRLAPRDEAWTAFSAARLTYAAGLEAMAGYWAVPSASWFGGSEPLRSPTHRPPLQADGASDERDGPTT